MTIRIEHRLGVATPAHAVWEAYRDIEAWPSWNPSYPSTKGKLTIGGPVELTVLLDEAPEAFTGRIVDWVPDTQLLMRGSRYGGLLRITRWVEVEVLTEEASVISNGEILEGPLEFLIPRRRRGRLYRALDAMSEAIKARAEAAWAEEQARA